MAKQRSWSHCIYTLIPLQVLIRVVVFLSFFLSLRNRERKKVVDELKEERERESNEVS